jgi:hypothetical protein
MTIACATDLAETILDGRKCQNTRNSYQRKYEHFRMWMKEKYPLCFRESGSTLDLGTIEKSHLPDFFGHICKKKSNPGTYLHPIQHRSFQHVSGYKSAINDMGYKKDNHLFQAYCNESHLIFLKLHLIFFFFFASEINDFAPKK